MELVPGNPRELALGARGGIIDCAPLPLVECWKLEKDFEPLGQWGIAVHRAAGSVLLFSKKEIQNLRGNPIGVTEETSTSVVLLDVLLRMRYGVTPLLKRGFSPEDEARLLIGDSALLQRERGLASYPFIYDLGREWVLWQKRPFVFARWVVRKSLDPGSKQLLRDVIAISLQRGLGLIDEISAFWAGRASLPPLLISDYLRGFSYELAEAEFEAMAFFRSLKEGVNVR